MAGVDGELARRAARHARQTGPGYAVEARFGFLDGERQSFREVGERARHHGRGGPPPGQPGARHAPQRRRRVLAA